MEKVYIVWMNYCAGNIDRHVIWKIFTNEESARAEVNHLGNVHDCIDDLCYYCDEAVVEK
jgi:hypothetical protein